MRLFTLSEKFLSSDARIEKTHGQTHKNFLIIFFGLAPVMALALMGSVLASVVRKMQRRPVLLTQLTDHAKK